MKELNPYKLGNIEELIYFDEDCNIAAHACPQYSDDSNELTIRQKRINAMQIFDLWKAEPTLWRFGYSEHLSKRASDTFKYVYDNGRNGLKELCSK